MSDDGIITDVNVREVIATTEEGQGILLGLHRYPEGTVRNTSIMSEYEVYEKSRILEALKQAGGSKTKAAEILKMSRTKLYQKLKRSISSTD